MTDEQQKRLQQLDTLKKNGGITEADYAKQKVVILGGMLNGILIPPSGTNEFPKKNREAVAFFLVVMIALLAWLSMLDNKSTSAETKTDSVKSLAAAPAETDTIRPKIKEISELVANENLKNLFTAKEDEFNHTTWYIPKTAPDSYRANGIYCYFEKSANKAGNLNFAVQYFSNKWLYIQHLEFLIDGKTYPFLPESVEKDSNKAMSEDEENGVKINGNKWEWFNEPISSIHHDKRFNMNMILALYNAKSVKVKFAGKQYAKVKTMSHEEIASIKTVLETYLALGGKLEVY